MQRRSNTDIQLFRRVPLLCDHLLSVDAALYSLRRKTWRRISKYNKIPTKALPSIIKLITWNLDFSAANAKKRLRTALTHIQNDVLNEVQGWGRASTLLCLAAGWARALVYYSLRG
jgi:hypothetical protein